MLRRLCLTRSTLKNFLKEVLNAVPERNSETYIERTRGKQKMVRFIRERGLFCSFENAK